MAGAPTQQRLVPLAPATSPAPSTNADAATPMAYACLTCTRRKVKCDKQAPTCSTCRKSNLECAYQAPPPRKRKRKPVDEMHDRLEQYEKLLKQSGILTGDAPTMKTESTEAVQIATPAVEPSERQASKPSGTLHAREGKTRYISGGFWRNMDAIEYQPSDDEDDEPDELEKRTTSTYRSVATRDPLSSAIFGPASQAVSLLDMHPSYAHAMKMWHIYVENIDPVCKVVHVPTTRDLLQRAAASPSTATKACEVILFAIYNFAIESITDQECQELFGQPKPELQALYLEAVRQALVNAQFLRTTDLGVLQGFILYLLCTRTLYDPHTFWILTGVAVRLGQRMGLHKAELEKDLNPFDCQIRRRVFWQLLPLDGIAALQSGTAMAIPFDSWDTHQPLNVEDDEIWPDMEHEPQPHTKPTGMIFCLARTELAKTVQSSVIRGDWSQLYDGRDFDNSRKTIASIQERLEDKYIRYCDITDPVHCLTLLLVRAATNLGMFRIKMNRVKLTEATAEDIKDQWNTAIKCLDTDNAAQDNQMLKRYRWHLNAVVQWEPTVWLLYQLQRSPALYYPAHSVWTKIKTIVSNHAEVYSMRRAVHMAVGRLTVKAWAAYHNYLSANHPGEVVTEPKFVTSMRSALHKREQIRNKASPFSGEQESVMCLSQNASETVTPLNTADFGFTAVAPDFQDFGNSMYTTDWMFWDQMMSDPNSFTVG